MLPQETGNVSIKRTDVLIYRKDVADPAVIARLVEILKTPSLNLQRKVSSILEFLTITEPCVDIILSVDIESGLEAVFGQKILDGMENNFLSFMM